MATEIKKDKVIIEKGQVLLLTEGEYSGYRPRVIIKAIQTFNLSAARREFRDNHRGQKSNFDVCKFVLWLSVENEFVEIMTYTEINSPYGRKLYFMPTECWDDAIRI